MLAIGVGLMLAAWALLVMSMERHHRALTGRSATPARLRWLRRTGVTALPLSLGCFVWVLGWSQGPVFWSAALMLCALAVALGLTALVSRRGR